LSGHKSGIFIRGGERQAAGVPASHDTSFVREPANAEDLIGSRQQRAI
jgi:hypothetical protein